MKEPWSLKSRARSCNHTGTPFSDGQTIHASLFPDPESSGYLRQDFCTAAWEELSETLNPYSYWKTIYRAPTTVEKPEQSVNNDPESLLRRLVVENQDHTHHARYILALMLERKKILVETGTNHEGAALHRFYEHRKSGDLFIIHDPQVSLDQIMELQEEVSQLLAAPPHAEVTPEAVSPSPNPPSPV